MDFSCWIKRRGWESLSLPQIIRFKPSQRALSKATGMQPHQEGGEGEKQLMGIQQLEGWGYGGAKAARQRQVSRDGRNVETVPRMGEMWRVAGARAKEWQQKEAARCTHVQSVLGRLRLGAAVEADEAHGLWRKEKRHHQLD